MARWTKNDLGGESCYIPGIGVSLDTTSDEGVAGFGWEVEIGEFYESGQEETLDAAKSAAEICARVSLLDMFNAVLRLRA